MNSFRVMDTKFRILKGGKIGLACSIALIGAMLILSSTKANATDYFTDVNTTLGTVNNTTLTFGVASAQTATNAGTTSVTRTETSADSVVFNPTAWATSSYTTVTDVGDFDVDTPLNGIDYSRYTLNTSNSALPALTLTFDVGAKALNISKINNLTIYSAPVSGDVNISSHTSYALTPTTTAPYVANLVFAGSNTVSQYTDIGNGNIQLNGSAIFTGHVTAGSVNVNTANTVTFNDTVNLSPGTTDELKFIVDGNVILNSNLTGNITSGGDNLGTVTILGDASGKAQSINGDIGSSSSSDIKVLNIGESGVSTNYSTTTINGNVFANSTVLNNGATNSSELILASGKNITSTITTTDAGKGILTLAGGTQTITGNIGSGTSSLNTLNIGSDTVLGNYSKTTINGNVFANSTVLNNNNNDNSDGTTDSSELILASGKNITSIITTADANMGILTLAGGTQTVSGTVVVADTKNINSAIITAVDNTGTLSLEGSSTVTGQVGASGASLKEINAGVAGSTSTFNSNVYASNLNMTGTGTVILNSDLTGNVVATGNNQGILTTTGLNKTITGNIGSSTSLDLNTLNVGSDTVLGNYSTTTINGNVFANSTVLNNNGTTNSSELILASGKNITSRITTADADMGILTLAGGTQTVTGQVGTGGVGGLSLEKVSSGANSSTSTFVNDVYSNTVENTGTGTTTFQDNVVATNVNVNAGTSTFQDNLTATTTTISTGTGNFNTVSGTTTSNLEFTDNGTANLNRGLTGDVTTTSDGEGKLNLVGSNNWTSRGFAK